MINFLKNLFGKQNVSDYKQLVKTGATIVDLRSAGEYKNGHIKGSINIPLDSLITNLNKIKKDKPVITCCASGMRSSAAKSVLKNNGFAEVYNGGGWASLMNKL